MLKKAGIVVAAVAAATLAMSPLAFAGGKDHEKSDKDHSKSDHDKKDKDKKDDEDHDKKDKHHDKKDKHHDKEKDKHHKKHKDDEEKEDEVEPVAAPDVNNEDNLSTACTFDNNQQTTSNQAGGNGVLGVVNLVVGAVVPVAANAPILSCNTVGAADLVDVNSENNASRDEQTRVVDSFND